VPQVLDGFVFGIILYAMRLGQGIRVHGAMSRDALRNLNELQEARCLWRPNCYKNIDIRAEQIVDSAEQPTLGELRARLQSRSRITPSPAPAQLFAQSATTDDSLLTLADLRSGLFSA
jgi:hypothetical protein